MGWYIVEPDYALRFGAADPYDFSAGLLGSMVCSPETSSPSFSRDTAATVTDFEGVIQNALIDELRSPGLRRVENLLSSIGVYVTETVTIESGVDYTLSCTGSGTITLSGASTEVVSDAEITFTSASTTLTLTVSGTVLTPQLEKVSGTQTTASEYVSNGVLSFPYHGAGVDGVKYLTMDRDGNTLVSRGASIEADATNLMINSDTPVTQTITVVSGSKYTISCTGTGTVTMSGAGTGTASEGTDVTITASTTSLVCTVDTLDTVQVELGPAATSYITTEGTAVTRTGDVLSYDIEGAITQGQGSLYCEFVCNRLDRSSYVFDMYSVGNFSNRILLKVTSDGYFYAASRLNSVYSAIDDIECSEGTHKIVFTYEDNTNKLYVDGALVGSNEGTFSIPDTLTTISIGTNISTGFEINSTIKDVRYYKEVLTQVKAEVITS